MRLHYHPLSPYARKAYAAILHRGDAVELRVLNVMGGDLGSPAFRAISPFGKMPVLETEEGPLIESTSIVEYLEEQGPRLLLPVGKERIARKFDRLGDLYLVDPVSKLWREPDGEGARVAPETAAKAWAIFEKQLGANPFVTGETFSLGDLSGAIASDYFIRLGVEPPASIKAWVGRCFEIPAMAKAIQDAMPFIERSMKARAQDE